MLNLLRVGGWMYKQGRGATQDYIIAHMYLNIAASTGYKDAINYRDIVDKEMNASQIEEAQVLARVYMKHH